MCTAGPRLSLASYVKSMRHHFKIAEWPRLLLTSEGDVGVGHFWKVGHRRVKFRHIHAALRRRFSIANLTWAWRYGGSSVLTHPAFSTNKSLWHWHASVFPTSGKYLISPVMWVLFQLGARCAELVSPWTGRRWLGVVVVILSFPSFFFWYHLLYCRRGNLRYLLVQTTSLIIDNSGLCPTLGGTSVLASMRQTFKMSVLQSRTVSLKVLKNLRSLQLKAVKILRDSFKKNKTQALLPPRRRQNPGGKFMPQEIVLYF